jgi:hypoxanthine phosphoribosyltransferase
MAFLSVSGEPASGYDDVAQLVAGRTGFRLLTTAELLEDAPEAPKTARILLARAAVVAAGIEAGVVVTGLDAAAIIDTLPAILRVHVASGRAISSRQYDVILNAALGREAMLSIVSAAAAPLLRAGPLSRECEASLQYDIRMRLARHGLAPAAPSAPLRPVFSHPSEQIFANLLDFYSIPWQYEPRSFPLQWDSAGNATEAFTPDFYLPEFDMFVELTTMKQSLVTKKNRKIRRLREIYPQVNIQVFYQKDIQDLVMKYGLK